MRISESSNYIRIFQPLVFRHAGNRQDVINPTQVQFLAEFKFAVGQLNYVIAKALASLCFSKNCLITVKYPGATAALNFTGIA